MKRLFTYSIVAVLFFAVSILTAPKMYAQEDTTKVEEGIKIDKGWDAMNYSLQKRYRPKGEEFVSKKFSDNTFISFSGAGIGLLGNTEISPATGAYVNVGFGKWFDRSNALRLELGAGKYHRKNVLAESLYMEFGVLHQFNMSTYLQGSREERFLEISTVEGLSAFAVKEGDLWGFGGAAHLGLNFNFRLSKRTDLFLEPMFSIYTSGIDPSMKSVGYMYDLAYKYAMGLRFNLYKEKKSEKAHWLNRDINGYMFMGAGAQSQNSSLVVDNVGILNSLGTYAYTGIGSWVNGFFGIKGSLFYSEHVWAHYQEYGDKKGRYMGARCEITLEPFYPINRKLIDERRFTCAISLGPEFGYLHKADVENNISKIYVGGTVAIQPNVKISKNVGLFLEPRLSLVPYSISQLGLGGVEIRVDYYDMLYNMTFGFTFHL